MTGLVLSPSLLAQVRARRKTQIRLPVDRACPFTPGRLYRARAINAGWTAAELKDHRDWASGEMPSRARAVLAYLDGPVDDAFSAPLAVEVTVLEVHVASLGAVDQQAAQREGWRFVAQFQNHWRSEHGWWEPDERVWVASFAVGDFRQMFDRPRLLKATCGSIRGNPDTTPEHQDYTDRASLAMEDEPEALSAADTERYGKMAHSRDAKRAKDPLREHRDEIADRLARMREHLAEIPNQEIERTVRRLERELAVLDRKLAA